MRIQALLITAALFLSACAGNMQETPPPYYLGPPADDEGEIDTGEGDYAQSALQERGSTRQASDLPSEQLDYRGGIIYYYRERVNSIENHKASCPPPGGPECERPLVFSFGGTPVLRGAAPFQAQLTAPEDFTLSDGTVVPADDWETRHYCGGALVAPGWVLTAAHCIDESMIAAGFLIKVGINNLADDDGRAFRIDRMECFNPAFCRAADRPRVLYQDDIALLHFTSEENSLIPAADPDQYRNIAITHVMADDNADTLTTWSKDGLLRTWDITNGAELLRQPQGADNQPSLLPEPTRPGRFLSTEDRGRLSSGRGQLTFPSREKVLTWDFGDGETCEIGTKSLFLDNNDGNPPVGFACLGSIRELRIAEDESYILTVEATDAFLVRAWDAETLAPLWSREVEAELEITDYPRESSLSGVFEIASDGLLMGEADAIVLIDPANGTELRRFVHPRSASWQSLNGGGPDRGARNLARNASYSDDGSLLITVTERYGSSDIWLWDVSSGEIIQRFAHDDNLVSERAMDAGLSPDGRHLLSWTNYGTLRMWDVQSGRLFSAMDQQINIRGVSFTGQDLRIVVDDEAGAIMWDARTGQELHRFTHLDRTEGAALSPDNRYLLTHSFDATARLWDLQTGAEAERLYHSGIVNGASYLFDPLRILTWSEDGTARITAVEEPSDRMIFDVVRSPAGSPLQPPVSERGPLPAEVSYIPFAASGSALDPASLVTVVGWGKTESVDGFVPYASLMEVSLNVMDNADCAGLPGMGPVTRDGVVSQRVHPRIFCARHEVRKTCKGDSGGPVMQNGTLVGIVSWGKRQCAGDGEPSIYTRVSDYADWISSVIEKPAEAAGFSD